MEQQHQRFTRRGPAHAGPPGSRHPGPGTWQPAATTGQLPPDVVREHIGLACLPSSPFWARRYTRDVLTRWNVPDDVIATAELLVSELATNAAKFSASRAGILDVGLRYLPGHIAIEVWDTDPNPPIAGDPDYEAEGGRGLMLVQALSKEWSYFFPPSGGKVVYCVIGATGAILRPGGKGTGSHV